jgi:hypothetical protein
MKTIPNDVELVMEDYVEAARDPRTLIRETDWVTVVDPRHNNSTDYHFTAWCRRPELKSLLDLEASDVTMLESLIKKVVKRLELNRQETRVLIHFPPAWWRLHVHFVPRSHRLPDGVGLDEVFDVFEVIEYLKKDTDCYRKRVRVPARMLLASI